MPKRATKEKVLIDLTLHKRRKNQTGLKQMQTNEMSEAATQKHLEKNIRETPENVNLVHLMGCNCATSCRLVFSAYVAHGVLGCVPFCAQMCMWALSAVTFIQLLIRGAA